MHHACPVLGIGSGDDSHVLKHTCAHTHAHAGHFSAKVHKETPPALSELALRVQRSTYFTKHLSEQEAVQGGQKSFFNLEERGLIMNGILCPVWNMPDCPHNQLGGGTKQVKPKKVLVCRPPPPKKVTPTYIYLEIHKS